MDREVVINSEDPLAADSLALIRALSAELGALYNDDGGASAFKPEDAAAPDAIFLVARIQGRPIGCGAIRRLAPGVAEVKRMFVKPGNRGRGLGMQILQQLEQAALNLGYSAIRLETGLKQPVAIRLYEKAGYERVPCYGQYLENPMSVCFTKRLV